MESPFSPDTQMHAGLPQEPADRAHAQAAHGRPGQRQGVPFSKTGQKITEQSPKFSAESLPASGKALRDRPGYELDSEWVEFFSRGKRPVVVRTPLPLETGTVGAALIDWIAFTVRPPEGEDHSWVVRQLQRLGFIGIVEVLAGGYAGYKNKAHYQEDKQRLCLIAWGGYNQAGTVYVSFPGQGCARIQQWPELRNWLEQNKATITRLDLAYDDFTAAKVSIPRAVEWYLEGGFSAGGRLPAHRMHGDWLLGDAARSGRTLEIGSREGGKLCRVYEKGKQLGQPDNPWVRVEVEWHNESRHIPYEAITEPGRYLAGSYECLNFLDQEQSRIRTTQRAAKVTFDTAMENGRQLVGKLVNVALEVYGGDYVEVVEQLRREGVPSRVEPYWDSVRAAPEILAAELTDVAVAGGTNDPHLTRGESQL